MHTDDLWSLSVNHAQAFRCIEMLRNLATRWNVVLPDGAVNITTLRAPDPRLTPPSMSVFQTHATWSNDSVNDSVMSNNENQSDHSSGFRERFDSGLSGSGQDHGFPSFSQTDMMSLPPSATPGGHMGWTNFNEQMNPNFSHLDDIGMPMQFGFQHQNPNQ
jgi:hypothetical protein